MGGYAVARRADVCFHVVTTTDHTLASTTDRRRCTFGACAWYRPRPSVAASDGGLLVCDEIVGAEAILAPQANNGRSSWWNPSRRWPAGRLERSLAAAQLGARLHGFYLYDRMGPLSQAQSPGPHRMPAACRGHPGGGCCSGFMCGGGWLRVFGVRRAPPLARRTCLSPRPFDLRGDRPIVADCTNGYRSVIAASLLPRRPHRGRGRRRRYGSLATRRAGRG